ncbi:hypothetical protein IBTHAUMO2_1050029 [Nitrosopumilaceae archaeon]|nr:hypothetical protein IBTHAUMO2_1050029 [Nitrosopumilaceae archaeon]
MHRYTSPKLTRRIEPYDIYKMHTLLPEPCMEVMPYMHQMLPLDESRRVRGRDITFVNERLDPVRYYATYVTPYETNLRLKRMQMFWHNWKRNHIEESIKPLEDLPCKNMGPVRYAAGSLDLPYARSILDEIDGYISEYNDSHEDQIAYLMMPRSLYRRYVSNALLARPNACKNAPRETGTGILVDLGGIRLVVSLELNNISQNTIYLTTGEHAFRAQSPVSMVTDFDYFDSTGRVSYVERYQYFCDPDSGFRIQVEPELHPDLLWLC